jgi:hypothetical protein
MVAFLDIYNSWDVFLWSAYLILMFSKSTLFYSLSLCIYMFFLEIKVSRYYYSRFIFSYNPFLNSASYS